MQTLLQILLYSANRIINLPEFPISTQPELTAKALNDEAGLQLMVGVSNPHTSRPAEPDAGNETLPGANALSPTACEIIAKNSRDFSEFFEFFCVNFFIKLFVKSQLLP